MQYKIWKLQNFRMILCYVYHNYTSQKYTEHMQIDKKIIRDAN